MERYLKILFRWMMEFDLQISNLEEAAKRRDRHRLVRTKSRSDKTTPAPATAPAPASNYLDLDSDSSKFKTPNDVLYFPAVG